MGFIKNIVALLMAGIALLFLQMAWKHIRTHDVLDLGTRLVVDLVFAAVFGYCAYALNRSAQAHYRRLAAMQEKERQAREQQEWEWEQGKREREKQEPPTSSVWPPPPSAF